MDEIKVALKVEMRAEKSVVQMASSRAEQTVDEMVVKKVAMRVV